MIKHFSFIWTTQFLLIVILTKNVRSFQELPRIKLENSPWNGNGTIRKNTILKLECTAPYSIYWEFTPSEFTVFKENSTVSTENSNIFIETLEIHYLQPKYDSEIDFSYGRTGNYTCKKTYDSTLSATSVYIYSKDNGRIFNVPLNQTTYARTVNGTEWAVPCPANLENAYLNISLFFFPEQRTANESSRVLMFPGNDSIHYDSRYGFLLKKSIYQRPIGQYICEASTKSFNVGNVTEKVTLSLQKFNVYPKSQYVTYRNKKEIAVTCESDEEVYINTDYSFMLLHKHPPQKSKVEHFNWSVSYELQENTDQLENRNEGEISCRIKTSDYVLHTWKHNWAKACSNYSIDLEPQEWQDNYWPSSRLSLYTKKVNMLKSSKCVTKAKCDWASKYFDKLHENEVRTEDVFLYFNSREILRSIYVSSSSVYQCVVDNYTTIIAVTPESIDAEGNKSTPYCPLFVRRAKKNEIFSGDTVVLKCQADFYLYRRGFQWKMIYKNGTESNKNSIKLQDDNRSDQFMTEIFSFEAVDKSFISVACMANLWNSSIWNNVTFALPDVKNLEIWNGNASHECNGEYETPKIILKRFRAYDYYRRYYPGATDPASKYLENKLASHIVSNTDITVLLSDGIEYVTLTCMASFPVKWFIEGQEYYSWNSWRDDELDRDGQNRSSNINDTLHHCFKSSYDITYWVSLKTGEYRCQHFNDPNIHSTVYGYFKTSGEDTFLGSGRHEVIPLNTEELEIYLPCRINNPNADVYLYSHENKGKYKLLKKNEYVSYNPKKGFLIETKSLSLSAAYICTTSTNRSRKSNSIYFTFKEKDMNGTTPRTDVTLSTFTMPTEIKFGFFIVFFFFAVAVVLQLAFLKKQVTFHEEIKTIVGTNINLDPHAIATFSDFENGSRANLNSIA